MISAVRGGKHDKWLTGQRETTRNDGSHLKKKKKKVFIASELFMRFSQTQVLPKGARNSRNNLAARKQLSPAVVEGGPRWRQRQALSELVPLPGHLAELEEDGVQVVAGWPVVIDGRGWGGRLAVNGRTCGVQHIVRGRSYLSQRKTVVINQGVMLNQRTHANRNCADDTYIIVWIITTDVWAWGVYQCIWMPSGVIFIFKHT